MLTLLVGLAGSEWIISSGKSPTSSLRNFFNVFLNLLQSIFKHSYELEHSVEFLIWAIAGYRFRNHWADKWRYPDNASYQRSSIIRPIGFNLYFFILGF